MTKKSRYFLAGSAVVLLAGLGAGTLAYLTYHRTAGVPRGLPAELRYVPVDAQLVAYADVKSVMASEIRRELERMTTGRRGQQQIHDFAGVDLEKDVNRVIAFMQPEGAESAPTPGMPPRLLLLAQGTFDQARIEQFMKDHDGSLEDYHGKHLWIRKEVPPAPRPPAPPQPPSDHEPQPPAAAPEIQQMRRPPSGMAVGFVRPDLIAAGMTDLVRQVLDASTTTANVTANSELMALIRDEGPAEAWVVGQFDAVSRRIGLSPSVRKQVPPLRMVSASARINGAVKATLKAQTADVAAADQLRDAIRGALSVARLQTGLSPDLQNALKTVELGGADTQVRLSFVVSPETLRAITPQRPPAPPGAPPPPAPPVPSK